MCFTVILEYFEIEDAISFQLLNKHMYYVKIPLMTDVVLGRRIDPELIIYSEYKNKKGAISLIVGELTENETKEELIENLLDCSPMLACKYKYTGFSWNCCEHKNLLVAVFDFRNERKVKLDHSNRFYGKKKEEFMEAMEQFNKVQNARKKAK